MIKPQEGAQTRFLNSTADICIYGGQAGGGKTWALLIEALRNIHVKDFGAVIFRRTMPQITNEGGLWDESQKIYPMAGGSPTTSPKLSWKFGGTRQKPRAKITMQQMQYENNCYDWQGSQIPLIMFDEITHFTEKQFFYMLSRNRSMCGVRPYIRATCNPEPDHFIRDMVDWWIDKNTGLPIQERSGIVRYFIRIDETLYWADSPEELIEGHGDKQKPLSFTFIPASITDNPALIKADPDYISKLQSLPLIERERLLGGNWNISANDGIVAREWVIVTDKRPKESEILRRRWSWDTASKDKTVNDPTVGTYWAETKHGHYLLDIFKDRIRYPDLKQTIIDKNKHSPADEIIIEDKSSGIALIQDLQASTQLPIIAYNPQSKDKVERLSLASVHFESRNVFFWGGCPYLQESINELVSFKGEGSVVHDDFVDTVSQYLLRAGDGIGLGFSKETMQDINEIDETADDIFTKQDW